jgi:hypothetical protein
VGRANVSSTIGEASQVVNVEMTADDWEKWSQFKRMSLIDKQSIEAPATSASAASTNFGGKNPYTLQSEYTNAPWLIDSGASRHMAGSYKLFYDYICDSKR